MLFHVTMDITVPFHIDKDRFEELKALEKARFQELQQECQSELATPIKVA